MVPFDIVKVLTAAAPIVATVASACKSEKEKPVEVIKEAPVTKNITKNNINVTYNNYFYINSPKEAIDIASRMQNQMNQMFSGNSSETRYML